jgi:hypothetical protein
MAMTPDDQAAASVAALTVKQHEEAAPSRSAPHSAENSPLLTDERHKLEQAAWDAAEKESFLQQELTLPR